ncbi:MAG: response regulator [Anaerolineae bacterium]|nr:MAG: response regulator [Anaerolineae bacterium]MCL4876925.1 response regulator [Anaerolineae bacterium]
MADILIVEDNPDIALLYERVFRNYQTETVNSAENALELLRRNHYQLVVLDLHLPEISGMEVLRQLRKSRHPTHILVISADDTLKHEAVSLGIDYWMTKPIEIDELMFKARELLQK